jgi:hypothetical protein
VAGPQVGDRSAGGRVLVAGMVGVLVGALIVGIAWLGSSLLGGAGKGSPAADAAMVCQILDGLPTLTQKNYDLPYTNRVSAASELAAAAAKEDARYHQLAVDAASALRGVQTFNIADVNAAVKAGRADC